VPITLRMPPGLQGLAAAVEALPAAWRGHYFEAIDSTQDTARAAALDAAPGRSIFVADFQQGGRGRHGRTWLARPGTALLVSMLFRESTAAPRPWRWTQLAAVALVEAIASLVPDVAPAIKWPNDVMLADRKVAGILAETSWDGRALRAIVGVGVNVNMDESDLADLPQATSLAIVAGHLVDRGGLLQRLVERIDHWLEQPPQDVHDRWQTSLWGRGQRLRLLDLGGEEEVVVLGAEADGSLRVRLPDGTERLTTTGELFA
jgi:BirA family transcriptional regulator, biotin operon repressor / biotin---[acetyl-CoA-carboxylase] ligase